METKAWMNIYALRMFGLLVKLPFIRKIVIQFVLARTNEHRKLRAVERLLAGTRKAVWLYIFGRYPAQFPPEETGRYLMYYGETSAGISHLRSNLKYFLTECVQLKRTAVLTKPRLTPHHNRGIALDTSWRKYLNFDEISKHHELQFIDYEQFCRKNFREDSVLLVKGLRSITADENRKYQVIIRDLSQQNLYGKTDVFTVPEVNIKKNWSPEIISEAQKVLERLPEKYCAIHIRRGDILLMFPLERQVTKPSNVLKKLREYNPERLPVFLMTDEPDKTFYRNLEVEFEIYRYYHFANLVELAEKNDNYFLFLVEQSVLDKAEIQINIRRSK